MTFWCTGSHSGVHRRLNDFVQVHPGEYMAKIVANSTCLPSVLNIRAAETKVQSNNA